MLKLKSKLGKYRCLFSLFGWYLTCRPWCFPSCTLAILLTNPLPGSCHLRHPDKHSFPGLILKTLKAAEPQLPLNLWVVMQPQLTNSPWVGLKLDVLFNPGHLTLLLTPESHPAHYTDSLGPDSPLSQPILSPIMPPTKDAKCMTILVSRIQMPSEQMGLAGIRDRNV